MNKDITVLVVDDADINLIIAEKIISREYSVKCVSSGEECLEYLIGNTPDLILLDLHMPDMDGFEVMEKLQSSLYWRDIPVIFLTADSDRDSEVQGFELGAMDFITKPFVAEVMMKRIERVLQLTTLQKSLKEEVNRQTAVAEERREKVEDMSLRMIRALAITLDAKDTYTNGHSSRVADYSVILAKKLGWSEESIDELYHAAILHDIGKIGVPDRVLNKPGKLNDEEYNIIKSHTVVGSDILDNVGILDLAAEVARHHHERYDGKGYPDGLAGENIPLAARIVGVADAFDAMSSRRVYRRALSKSIIREELIRGRGMQFDPQMAEIFIQLLDEGALDEISHGKSVDTDELPLPSFALFDQVDPNEVILLLRGEGERQISQLMADQKGCLLLIDLDNLKEINEKEGHTIGDQALDMLGKILVDSNRGISCRLGGDEFLMYLPDGKKEDGEACAQSLIAEFAWRKNGRAEFAPLSISIGLCLSTPADSFEDVYSMADKALYFVKQTKKGGFYFYTTAENFEKNHSDIELAKLVTSLNHLTANNALDIKRNEEIDEMLTDIANKQLTLRRDFVLAMITLENGPGETHFIEEIEGAMGCMEFAIKQSFDGKAECIKYSNVQYFIVMTDVDESEVRPWVEKVFSDFYKRCNETRLQPSYAIEPLRYESLF